MYPLLGVMRLSSLRSQLDINLSIDTLLYSRHYIIGDTIVIYQRMLLPLPQSPFCSNVLLMWGYIKSTRPCNRLVYHYPL